jgi:hypothetical protein
MHLLFYLKYYLFNFLMIIIYLIWDVEHSLVIFFDFT